MRALAVVLAAQAAKYQPYWAATAEFSARLGWRERAVTAYERAAAMTGDPAVRLWLGEQRGRVDACAGSAVRVRHDGGGGKD